MAACFDRIFENHLSNDSSRSHSYRKAEEEFQREFNMRAYSGWDSYRASRAQRRRRKGKGSHDL